MTISTATTMFVGKKVVDYDPKQTPNLSKDVVYRLALEYEDTTSMAELIEQFLSKVDKSQVEALIIGAWPEPHDTGVDDILATLIAHTAELPNFRALFVGDMTYEECEISWIVQGNYTALLNALPQLEVLRIRGSSGLKIEAFSHANLRSLIIECGGLPAAVPEALVKSHLPSLEHLELWLGDQNYGFEGDLALYQRVVLHLLNPKLRYLGLRNAEIADQLAQWLSSQEWLAQLETLDLSLGNIGDRGAQALLDCAALVKLSCLNLSHHYISDEMQAKLAALPIMVLLDDAQEADDDEDEDGGGRYVAVGE